MQAVLEPSLALLHAAAATGVGVWFHELVSWWASHPFYFGIVLAVLLAAQLLVMLASTVQRLLSQRRAHRLECERLRWLIKSAYVQFQEAEQSRLLWNGFRKFRVKN